jgi:sortase A
MPHIDRTSGRRRSGHSGLWLMAECAAWTVGFAALTWWAATTFADRTAARAEIERFASARQAPASALRASARQAPDFQLWSPKRIQQWRTAQATPSPMPLGVLRVARLNVEAAILEGTDDATLNRAVGHIAGTAAPGDAGNAGIAGHRDSFFRALKNIAVGDAVEITTPSGALVYHVERTWIVTPEDVWVLDPTSSSALTLVTCYPFHFVGSAPQRFIVRAVRSAVQTAAERD